MSALNLIRELSALLGKEAVEKACQEYLGSPSKKQKKERKPRGKSSWNLEVDKVLSEMRAGKSEEDAKAVTYKIAYAEASRRRREGNPEAQAKYEANQAKRVKGKKVAATPAPPAPSESDDEEAAVDGVPSRLDPKTVYQFLFDLQESGRINMLACKPELVLQFGMTDEEASDIRQQYVSHYAALKMKYGKASAPTASVAAKKAGAGRPKKELPVSRAKIPIIGTATDE